MLKLFLEHINQRIYFYYQDHAHHISLFGLQVEKELQMIRQQLTTASQKLQEVSVQKQSSELDSNMKSQKIEDLQSQISKLEQSVGDEVPGLIQENMEQKEKIREERKKADKAGLEVRLE